MTDSDAFEGFVRRYQDMVFATAVRLVGREADAEDIAQTVFLKAFERFSTLASSPAAGGWLKTVTTNLCLNHLARYRFRWRLFSEMTGPDAGESEESASEAFESRLTAATPERDDLDRAERQRQLERALRSLPDDQRVALVLYHFEEKSYQDIASLLGVTVGKVKTDMRRGRQALKRWLESDSDGASLRS